MAPSRRSQRRAEEEEESSGVGAAPEDSTGRTSTGRRVVPERVRERQRAVAEREASRLARPEVRPIVSLGHADRQKSAVTSTPFGVLTTRASNSTKDSPPQEWCGPFSVARQMIAAREETKRREEAEAENGVDQEYHHPLDQVMEELELEKKRKAHPSISWKSSLPGAHEQSGSARNSSLYAKRKRRANLIAQKHRIPTLFQTCLQFLVDHIEFVESLGDVDSSIRTRLLQELVARHKLDPAAFDAIAENGTDVLELTDASSITQEQLTKALQRMMPSGLQYIMLDQAGRCFGPAAADAIVEAMSSKLGSLQALSIGGAYLLKDVDAVKLIEAVAPTLSSLEYKACPMLGVQFCKGLTKTFATTGKLLELSLEDIPIGSEGLETLTGETTAFRHLKSLSMRRIIDLTDAMVHKLLLSCTNTLERLDLSDNHDLTDATLSSLRSCVGLQALHVSGLKHLTPQGLEALFTHVPGMAPPPSLRVLDFGRLDHEAVTDDFMLLAIQASTSNKDSTVGGLVQVNVEGSSVLTDSTLEKLASSCHSSLQYLHVSFCTAISDQGLGYLVDKCGSQLSNIEVWGCAQISDSFLDGHRRVADPGLHIVGAWMKQNSVRAFR
jgi:hypothetical protein